MPNARQNSRTDLEEYPVGYRTGATPYMSGSTTTPPSSVASDHDCIVEIPDGAIRPLIIDSHLTARLGLSVLLQHEPWVAKCLLAHDFRDGAALARRHRPEVALLDITDAGAFVASATAGLRDAHPSMQIILTSRCAWTAEPSTPARELGAAGFVSPNAKSSEILAAVRAAVLAQDTDDAEAPPRRIAKLTERERRLLALLSTGATNKEIATKLHLGPDSVKKNLSALYRKLGARNRTDAAKRATEWLQTP